MMNSLVDLKVDVSLVEQGDNNIKTVGETGVATLV